MITQLAGGIAGFEKVSKIDKPLAKMIKKKEREDTVLPIPRTKEMVSKQILLMTKGSSPVPRPSSPRGSMSQAGDHVSRPWEELISYKGNTTTLRFESWHSATLLL